jgi:transposase
VATLLPRGASNFTYAEASWTQALADWIGAHSRAFAALGGVPKLLVPDNTKVAVIKAFLYEPQVNRTYAEMATHYDTAILPARPRRPRDSHGADHRAMVARPPAPPSLQSDRADSRVASDAVEVGMMYIAGHDRSQLLLLPEAVDDYVGIQQF